MVKRRCAGLLGREHVGRENLRRRGQKLVCVSHQRRRDLAVDVCLAVVLAANVSKIQNVVADVCAAYQLTVPGSASAKGSAPVKSAATSAAFSGLASIRATNAYGVLIVSSRVGVTRSTTLAVFPPTTDHRSDSVHRRSSAA